MSFMNNCVFNFLQSIIKLLLNFIIRKSCRNYFCFNSRWSTRSYYLEKVFTIIIKRYMSQKEMLINISCCYLIFYTFIIKKIFIFFYLGFFKVIYSIFWSVIYCSIIKPSHYSIVLLQDNLIDILCILHKITYLFQENIYLLI